MSSLIAIAVRSAEEGSNAAGSFFSLGLLLLIPFGMYFFMIRPQRRRMREQQELQGSIQVGDEVVTTSGLYGRISGEDGEHRFWMEIDDDVQIRIARAAIQSRVNDDTVDDDSADDAADDADAESANAD